MATLAESITGWREYWQNVFHHTLLMTFCHPTHFLQEKLYRYSIHSNSNTK
jgi:hypothetical protein